MCAMQVGLQLVPAEAADTATHCLLLLALLPVCGCVPWGQVHVLDRLLLVCAWLLPLKCPAVVDHVPLFCC
jgi:hypothetical protein